MRTEKFIAIDHKYLFNKYNTLSPSRDNTRFYSEYITNIILQINS